MTDRFPILGARDDVQRGDEYPVSVAWSFVHPFGAQAQDNHGGQSLHALAARGGLSPQELWCAAHGMRLRDGFKACANGREAIDWLRQQPDADVEWRRA